MAVLEVAALPPRRGGGEGATISFTKFEPIDFIKIFSAR